MKAGDGFAQCPHKDCNELIEYSYDNKYNGDSEIIECPECGKQFTVTMITATETGF